VEFVLVPLGSFSTLPAEPGIFQTEFNDKWAAVAGTATIFGDTEMAFSGNAVDRFVDLSCAPVIGSAGRAYAYGLHLTGQESALFNAALPECVEPLFKRIHIVPLSNTQYHPYPVIS
jgi:hypothetical protein